MKTIQLCTPLFLMFAIACDDMNASVEVNDNANTQRVDGEEPVGAKRAGYLVKASNALEAITQNSPLSIGHEDMNCETISVSALEEVVSDCPEMEDKGFTVDFSNCVFDGGDTFDATLVVSVEDIESSPEFLQTSEPDPAVLLRAYSDWSTDVSIDSNSGASIQSCGILSRNPSESILDYNMEIVGDDEDVASYHVETRNNNGFARRGESQTRIQLLDATNVEAEVIHMDLWTRASRAGQLLPLRAMARIDGADQGRLMFRAGLTENNSVRYRSTFRHFDVVEIPTL